MTGTVRPSVVIVGGYHDGIEGTVNPDCITAGFIVQQSTDSDGEEWMHGYFIRHRDDQGRYVFSPGRP